MYGAILRVVALTPIAVLFGLLLEPILTEFLGVMAKAPGGQDTKIYAYTSAAVDNWLFIALLSLIVLLIAHAVVEREMGGVLR